MIYRTAIVTTALTPEERRVLRQLAYEQETTISTIVRRLLLCNTEFSGRLSFLSSADDRKTISGDSNSIDSAALQGR